jgi:hypothetical protein
MGSRVARVGSYAAPAGLVVDGASEVVLDLEPGLLPRGSRIANSLAATLAKSPSRNSKSYAEAAMYSVMSHLNFLNRSIFC